MSEQEKRPVGRPAHEPSTTTKRQVELLAAFGNTEEQIAQIIGISPPTLRNHYRDELDLGHVKASNAVAQNMFRIATFRDTVRVKGADGKEVEREIKPNSATVKAGEFWLKTRAGWSEYAPPPRPPKDAALGKKEQAQLDSDAAGAGNEWGDLVDRPTVN